MSAVFSLDVMTFKVLTDQIKIQCEAQNCDFRVFSQNFLEDWMMHAF